MGHYTFATSKTGPTRGGLSKEVLLYRIEQLNLQNKGHFRTDSLLSFVRSLSSLGG